MRTAPAPGFLDSVLDCCLGVILQGQVALVTGAGRRIGRAIALRLAAEGARMVVHYRNSRSEAEAVAAEIVRSGGEAVCIQAELTGAAEINRLFQGIEQSFGRLDILVNNAAIFGPTPVGRTQEAQWDAILDTNLKAQFFAAQRAAPLLAQSGRGRIINFASLGGLQAWPKYTAYSVSKAGVIMLTRCLARALAPAVTVNAIAPGTILMGEEEDPSQEHVAVSTIPLKRYGKPSDVTDLVIFLAGKASYMTVQVLIVGG